MLNIFGLLLNLFGVVLLFLFGMPFHVAAGGKAVTWTTSNIDVQVSAAGTAAIDNATSKVARSNIRARSARPCNTGRIS